jgi:hypothetical protein
MEQTTNQSTPITKVTKEFLTNKAEIGIRQSIEQVRVLGVNILPLVAKVFLLITE